MLAGNMCWLLPDKHEALAVLCGEHGRAEAVKDFLTTRHWTNVIILLDSQVSHTSCCN